MVGLLLRLGEHDRDRLAVPMDPVVLHHRTLDHGRPALVAVLRSRQRRLRPWRVLMGHHQHDAGRGHRRRRVDGTIRPLAMVLETSAA